MKLSWITIYASSSDALSNQFYEFGYLLADQLIAANFNLVYGGSIVGIMGRVAHRMKQAGQKVVGVIPKRIHDMVPPLPEIDELIITETMYERKKIMAERGDAYICLPGGFGTLEEMLEIITQKQLHFHSKPIVICNFNHIFNHLLKQFNQLVENNFAKEITHQLYHVVTQPDQIVPYLNNYEPSSVPDKWYDTKNGFKSTF